VTSVSDQLTTEQQTYDMAHLITENKQNPGIGLQQNLRAVNMQTHKHTERERERQSECHHSRWTRPMQQFSDIIIIIRAPTD